MTWKWLSHLTSNVTSYLQPLTSQPRLFFVPFLFFIFSALHFYIMLIPGYIFPVDSGLKAHIPSGSGWNMDNLKYPIVPASSHNDEMQALPLTQALSQGIPTIEVDVRLVDGVLLARHNPLNRSSDMTLERLYLSPLFELLSTANSGKKDSKSSRSWNGVFARAPQQELMLMIDMKADGEAIWPALIDAIEPFRERGWLTTYRYPASANATGKIADFYDDGTGELTVGPLRIVGTGNTPLWRVYTQQPARYVFFDAPLVTLSDPLFISVPPSPTASSSTPNFTLAAKWTPAISPYASSKWPLSFYLSLLPIIREGAIKGLKDYSEVAHAHGIKVRWWGVLRRPGFVRRRLWHVQRATGVDWLNADDLAEVAYFLREEMRESETGAAPPSRRRRNVGPTYFT